MNWYLIVLAVVLPVPTFFLWCFLHEGAHYLAAKWTVGVENAAFRFYPIRTKSGRISFASVRLELAETPKPWQEYVYALAPRVPDIIAASLFPIAWDFSGWVFVSWNILWGVGVVDLFVGSIGYHERSDLRRASYAVNMEAWPLRAMGFGLVVLSVGTWIAFWVRN